MVDALTTMILGKPACTVGPPLTSFLFILALSWNLQVEGRPYGEASSDSDCLPLTLTHPKRGFLSQMKSKISLPEELMKRTVLTAKNDSISAWESRAVCEASGTGSISRFPWAAERLLRAYTGKLSRNAESFRDSHRIENAAVIYTSENTRSFVDPAAFLLSQSHVRTLCQYESVLLEVTCPDARHCYHISLRQAGAPHPPEVVQRRLISRHILAYSSQEQHKAPTQSHAPIYLAGLIVGVAGILLMFFILVLCAGGGDKYEPTEKTQSTKARTPSSEVATAQDNATQEMDLVQDSKTNGRSVSVTIEKEVTMSLESVDVHSHGSSDHDQLCRRSPPAESPPGMRNPEAEKRARALSAPRSFDPLPELPKLELAEDPIAEGDEGRDAEGEEEEDDPYDVVPENNPDRMSNHSHSGSEDNDMSPERHRGGNSPFPVPYGKVSRHAQPGEQIVVDENDSYAEVRDVVRHGPQMNRDRSHTSPVHIDSTGLLLRDRRVYTESATHMPLPRIPGGKGQPAVEIDSSATYDSIRGEGNSNESGRGTESNQRTSSTRQRDQLYESVGEKDLYESVPDDLTKLDSPGHLSGASSLSPTKNPESGANLHLPPASPVPSAQLPDTRKKTLEKTFSSSTAEEGKRRFSFFGRKKTASVSAARFKKGEAESPILVSASPQHKSPPLPNIPAPLPPNGQEEEEEDTYDKVTPGLPPGENLFMQAFDDPASKSKSLPMGYRTGTRSNLPLPKLPEDSGSATVVHKRVLEGGVPDEYDTVRRSPADIPDEPNYDTVNMETGNIDYPELEIDPPYDKVDKEELMKLRQRELENMEGGGAAYDPPYDKVDQDKLNQLREQEALIKNESEASSEGRSLSLGYSVVRGVTPEGERGQEEEPGPRPEHDEEGYAVVPKEFKMRKRAMSSTRDTSKGKDGGHLSPDSVMVGYKVIEYDEEGDSQAPRSQTPSRSPQSPPQSSEEQYASVNMHAKREDRRRQELEEVLQEQESLRVSTEEPTPRSVSPIPPPLPPAPNPEDLVDDEDEQPPIPPQMEGFNGAAAEGEDLIGEDLRGPSDTSDPPYARVRSKVDNPYAVVNPPYTEIDVGDLMVRIQGKGTAVNNVAMDEEAGYDVIGTVGIRAKTASTMRDKPYDTVADMEAEQSRARDLPNLNDTEAAAVTADQTYDTIADLKEEIANRSKHRPDLPTLETASESNIYDSLSPQSPPTSPTDQPPRSMV